MGHEGYQATSSKGEEGKKSFRDDSYWKNLYFRHVNYLKEVYRELTPDGEPYTDELLDTEAKVMADAQYKMRMRQLALERKTQKKDSLPHGEEKLSKSTIEELRKQSEKGNIFAEKVLKLRSK